MTAMPDGRQRRRSGKPVAARSNEERIKRIKRKANPWRRRVARLLIQFGLLAALVGGAVVGVRAVLEVQNRIELPRGGPVTTVIRSTTIELTLATSTPPASAASASTLPVSTLPVSTPPVSTPPVGSAPVGSAPAGNGVSSSQGPLTGTVTIDPVSGAFEFSGEDGGLQDGITIAGRLDSALFIRSATTAGAWLAPADPATDPLEASLVARVIEVARAVADAASIDEILTDPVRDRYVTLLAAESSDDTLFGAATRYDLEIDTERFARDYPLRWRAFATGAVLGASDQAPLPISVELADDGLLVAVDAGSVGWAWRRVSSSTDPFVPDVLVPDPSTYTIRAACTSADGTAIWQTTFPSCQEALDAARGIAEQTGVTTGLIQAGVAGAEVGSRIDDSVARLCAAMEDPTELAQVEPWQAPFGSALVAAGVCVGDPTVLTS